ncbi:kinase-like protein [Xylona heveae TC161]|uniref:Kinase-like protein n=1 Tax=Xylona heveae (strain CBS 132557 / TC161) TaxID=1328760 RepID=A0A165A3U7_XYLHT|nr:kinase-like protein [Xylona heveae TC161]KZF19911.1 kinase-like protein [Xylona heveae TC161]
MNLDLSSLSNEDIVYFCNTTKSEINGSSEGGRRIIRLSSDIVVKAGWSVTAEEAANQAYAYTQTSACKNTGLTVPQVYRYFRTSGTGYLVMEYVQGISLEKISVHNQPELLQRLAMAICTLSSLETGQEMVPGPRNGGTPRGYLFSEDGAGTTFTSVNDLNLWLNERARLRKGDPNGEFRFKYGSSADCVFCHLDLVRRNILLLPDGKFCLLDWEYAGFYPRAFEIYCLRFAAQSDYEFSQAFLSIFEQIYPWSEDDSEKNRQLRMLNRVYRNNLKYNL